MRPVNVGFIGAGQFISAAHLPTAHASDSMRVYAIADLNESLLAQHARTYQPAYTTTDYRRLLDDPEVGMVVIGTRQDLHARLICEALRAGKWVYCEKPMAETPQEIQNVLAAEANSSGRLAIGLNRRFAPAYADAKKLMGTTARPWILNYRLMAPHLTTGEKDDFYRNRPRIIYEGCHILDLICWFLDAQPVRVSMIGDAFRNNSCLFDFHDGSQVTFICGSIGALTMTKEYMEVFSHGHSITVSDFIDMRVRGFEGQTDRLYPLDRGAHAEEILRFGFDFYEVCRSQEILHNPQSVELAQNADIHIDRVKRPLPVEAQVAAAKYDRCEPPYFDSPDKGRVHALEHFARCRANDILPQTPDAHAGARSTQMGLALLESLRTNRTVDYAAFVSG